MMTCRLSGNVHSWLFAQPKEGIHPADGKAYGWLGGQCACGMRIMMEMPLSDAPIVDPREFT